MMRSTAYWLGDLTEPVPLETVGELCAGCKLKVDDASMHGRSGAREAAGVRQERAHCQHVAGFGVDFDRGRGWFRMQDVRPGNDRERTVFRGHRIKMQSHS